MTAETIFDDVETWLEAISEGRRVSIMSPKLASSALGETTSALSKKLKGGEIPRIVIAGESYISADHVQTILQRRRQTEVDVVKILERVARRGLVIFYGDLMSQVGMRWQSPPDRAAIGVLLGNVSTRSYKEHGILLSSIVHRKGPAPTHPGPGYINLLNDLAERFGFEFDPDEDEAEMIERHMKAVYDFYRDK